ncbi:hypothetical protein EYC84_007461 [Monilinia fructicola]|uniref:Uncharacterized protein n=1 Tax=Monilinia fructicola TaxID=38448 RepID=A0A5M9JFU9_MONFR|nr:hypothetical protein EYC84_007461 [Monilinia fructicola]
MLKDFARNQDDQGNCIAIVHAHVYLGTNGPLTGWVSVQGKEDFIKALRHLERGIIGNRALIVDGRNETCSIPLFDLTRSSKLQNFNKSMSAKDIMPITREVSIATSMTATFKNDGVAFRGKALGANLVKEGERPATPNTIPCPIDFGRFSFPSARDRRSQSKSQVASQDAKSSNMRLPSEKKMERTKEMDIAAEDRERRRIKASFVSDVAAIAVAAKKEEASKSPMIVNGSSPGKNA